MRSFVASALVGEELLALRGLVLEPYAVGHEARQRVGLLPRAPTLGARIPVTDGVPDDHRRDSARDSCGLSAAAQHSNPIGRFQFKPALIQGEGHVKDRLSAFRSRCGAAISAAQRLRT
jgi:hypothetical protein